ncbi:MAG: DUF3137 domain-containing protein [Sedimentisphaerales bacterium]|nr:DUF3137 domain-containing protein [Sedimentisphaerales bacterium]
MKTLQEVQTFCHDHLLADLQRLEVSRKRAALAGSLASIAVLTLAIVLATYWRGFEFSFPSGLIVVVVGGMFTLAMCVLAFVLCAQPYRRRFKQQIIGRLVSFVQEGLSYEPKGYIPQEEFRRSGIFQSRIDSYTGEDLVFGKIGRTEIRFSEVDAKRRHTTSGSKGRTQTHYETIFKGFFLIADFNKDFRGQTLVLPDVAQRLLGPFGQTLQAISRPGMQLIRLEDPEFEKEFVVYGTDQIEARYILSPALMQRILQFKRKTASTIYISFVNSRLYLAIETHRDLFEPRLFSSLLDTRLIEDYYQQLTMLIGVVDEMNLNTRIWSKQ